MLTPRPKTPWRWYVLLTDQLGRVFPGLPNARWVALRLLEGDDRVIEAVRNSEFGGWATEEAAAAHGLAGLAAAVEKTS